MAVGFRGRVEAFKHHLLCFCLKDDIIQGNTDGGDDVHAVCGCYRVSRLWNLRRDDV